MNEDFDIRQQTVSPAEKEFEKAPLTGTLQYAFWNKTPVDASRSILGVLTASTP